MARNKDPEFVAATLLKMADQTLEAAKVTPYKGEKREAIARAKAWRTAARLIREGVVLPEVSDV